MTPKHSASSRKVIQDETVDGIATVSDTFRILPEEISNDPEIRTSDPDIAEVAELPGTLDFEQLKTATEIAAAEQRRVLEVLEERSGLDGTALTAELARIFDFRVIPTQRLMTLDPDFETLPIAEARNRDCVLVKDEQRSVAIISNPFDTELRSWLESRVPNSLDWVLVATDDLRAYISRHEQSMRAMDSALEGTDGHSDVDINDEDLSLASISKDSSPVVRLVHSTLYDALRAGASDIHMETSAISLVIRYRIDGVLVHVGTVKGAEIAEQVISRIKVMSELDIAERRIPQDGRFKSAYDGRPIDFRVSIMPSSFGEDAVLRVLDKQAVTDELSELTIASLGFEDDMVNSLKQLSERPYGMLLVTGPTGSGKTTTLYAAISETNSSLSKIVTIEDPVEYQLSGVLQIPVNEKKGLTFARGLRSILRHDPDKIMVGEIRDPETAQIAVQSALTGHLVFTTVHANNVFDVLSRFTHMDVDPYSFVSALNGILAQRLLRLVCGNCSESIRPTSAMLEASGESAAVARDFEWRAGKGCGECRGTGFKGRRAVGELLVLNDELREAIIGRVPVRQLKELAHDSGMQFIRSAALNLVRGGLTTIDEVNRVTTLA